MCIQETYSDLSIIYHRHSILVVLHSLVIYLHFICHMYPLIISGNYV